MQSKWDVTPYSEEQKRLAHDLSEALSLSRVMGLLLVGRGIRTKEEAQRYLNPSLSRLHDPFLLKGMKRAVERISLALDEGEQILLYGDHDVDGTSAVSLVSLALRRIFGHKGQIQHYIPNRQDEGYGISLHALGGFYQQGGRLVIVLDCGIKAHQELDHAQSLGLEVIVCDHHQPADSLPSAFAIINPKQADCPYPCKELSGCGVGYKLMQALALTRGIDPRKLYAYLDLVGISIAADIVPLVDENRILLYHGLKQLGSHPTLGIKALIQVTSIQDRQHDVGSIIYYLAPRINAAGRLMNGIEAVHLMTATRYDEALTIARRLDSYNLKRRQLDSSLTEQALQQIETEGIAPEERKVLVIYAPEGHQGVMGIVASRLVERYQRPTVVLTRGGSEGEFVGSGRSMPSIDLYQALEATRKHLINFGGHRHAVGLTISEAEIPTFRKALEHYFEEYVESQALEPRLEASAQLSIEEITPELGAEIARMAPFGLGNERPSFITYRLRDAGGTCIVGKQNQHLRLKMTDRYCKHRPLWGIALGQAVHAPWILKQQSFGIYYSIELQQFYGKNSLQLQVIDLHTQG